MLPKAQRLTVHDIDTLSQGRSVFGGLVSMRFRPSETTKFAVSVSKKVAPLAVTRNKIRRRTYSLLRSMDSKMKKPVFAMLMPKKEFSDAHLDVLKKEIVDVFTKAGLLK